MARYDDLNTKQIWVVGLVSALLTAITILAVQVLYYAMLGSHEARVLAGAEYTSSKQAIEEQLNEINSYGRDSDTGTVQIPIDRAIELMIEQHAAAPAADEEA
jgi:flagellar biosynthesis/type III secretory pathway M-ring protein FliF/YscJ